MSVEALSWAWGQDVKPTPRKLVLIALADAASEDGVCWPSHRRLAEKCGLQARTVRRWVRSLEADGLLRRVVRERENGSQTSNKYELVMTATAFPTPPGGDGPPGRDRPPPPVGDRPPTPGRDRPPLNRKEGTSTPSSPPSEVERIFDLWRTVMGHSNAVLDDNRRRVIERALKFASPDECAKAIIGCSKSDFNMGRSDRGKRRYDQLSLILRNREKLEDFMALAPQTAGLDALPSADDATIREAKRHVLQAFDLAGSAEARRRGDESERLLRERGIRVVRSAGARPRFETAEQPDGDGVLGDDS